MTRRGFTLLEVLVALAILGLAVASVLELLGTSARNAARAQSTTRGLLVAEGLMEELLTLTEDELRDRDRQSGERIVPDSREGAGLRTSGRERPVTYRWDVRVTGDRSESSMYRVELAVRWEEPASGVVELATLRRFPGAEAIARLP